MIFTEQKNLSLRGTRSATKFSFLLLSVIIMSLAGCTTCANAVPHDEPTMAEIYEQAMQESHHATLEQTRSQVKNIRCFQSSSLQNKPAEIREINALFPTLPNPQLVMYIYPHLSRPDESPVPGYTTAFSLYEKDYYAIEGEN